jgi:multisubunit Na+/H+ antiporter MnhE subunit
MADGNRASEKVDFEVGYDLKSQKVSAKLSLPSPPLLPRFTPHDVPFRGILVRMTAGDDARNNTPDHSDSELQAAERTILERRDRRSAPDTKFLFTLAQVLQAFVDRYTPTPLSGGELKSEIEAKQANIESLFARDLQQLRRDHQDADNALQLFRNANGLTRPAKVPETVLQPLAITLAAFLIDGLINATLFAQASSNGFIGGLTIAFMLSAVNILLGFLTGFIGLRNTLHISDIRKRIGWVVVGVGVLLGILFNLLVAHFRDVAEETIRAVQDTDPGLAMRPVSVENVDLGPVFASMASNPLGLSTIFALLLLISGLVVFAIGAIEGRHGFDDPYPGYGDRTRIARKAQSSRTEAMRRAKASLIVFYQHARNQFTRSIAIHDYYKDQIQRGAGILTRESRRATDAERRVTTSAERLVQLYRQVNQRVRNRPKNREKYNTTPPPAYFQNRVRLESLIPVQAIAEAERHATDALQRIKSNIAALNEAKARVNQLQKDMPRRIENIEQSNDEARGEILLPPRQ